MPLRALTMVAMLLSLASCSSTSYCDCARCVPALALTIMHPMTGMPTVSGDVALSCVTGGTSTLCTGEVTAAGSYDFDVSFPGLPSQRVTLVADPIGAAASCCGCEWKDTRMLVTFDAGALDAGALDAGALDGGALDAGHVDAGTACEPERVEFPMGGDLSVGTLCDDVFVCVPDAAAGAAVEAAAPQFDCSSEPTGSPCSSGVRCAYRDPGGPSTLDRAEVEAICAVTAIEPPPDRIVCVVYL